MQSIGRRKFFNKLSLSAIGAVLLSSYPLNLFAKKKNFISTTIKIKLHPNSVKRTK
jgi:hypothetical protein